MERCIEYGRDVVVGGVYSGAFHWYVSEKEIWVLDQVKWGAIFLDAGHAIPDGFADRFGIGVVDDHTVGRFLACIKDDEISTRYLGTMLAQVAVSEPDDRLHLMPGLFVDFDRKVLISNFPEPLEYERFVPDGWTSSYGNFDEKIPKQHRYWSAGNDG